MGAPFKQYFGMGLTAGLSPEAVILRRSKYYAHLYNVWGIPLPLGEFLSRGNEIHAKALLTYDAAFGASFQTYLWHRLGLLKDVAVSEQRRILRAVPLDDVVGQLRSGIAAVASEELCLDDLSPDAAELVEFVLSRGIKRGRRLSPDAAAPRLGWGVDRAEDAWEEVGVWVAAGGRPVERKEYECFA